MAPGAAAAGAGGGAGGGGAGAGAGPDRIGPGRRLTTHRYNLSNHLARLRGCGLVVDPGVRADAGAQGRCAGQVSG
ncbi:hypothetical protein Ani05nite_03920 [Amorphoplanes nipponensis]|uniref:Uncharacterized protein n=1 Tax=Actinoplanes nipponensis TaxID=135950 RepID=A0A919JA09_9ACTN|nr:hypothetical protein Ani05nite_03920 [Actinoplanes nipponensis]